MQRYLKENTVGRVIFICATILVGTFTAVTGIFGIANKVTTLRDDLARLEHDFIAEQKTQLTADVNTLIHRIDNHQDMLSRQLEQNLAHRVEEARAIAVNINRSLGDKVAQETLLATIREAIRPIRFNAQQGYCFILSDTGDAILYPADPEIEGSNFFTNNVGEGDKVVSAMLELAGRQGHGFLHYDWYKPDDNSGTLYPKISYLSRLEELGLIFGTGEYLDNLEALARNSIIDELRNSWRSTLMDYYFVYQLHDLAGGPQFATMLINNNRPDLEGQVISEFALDTNGKSYRQEFMDGIRHQGEAHVIYTYQKPDGSGTGRKLSYFKLYPRWNWIVARGIYLDRLDADIAGKQQELRQRVQNEMVLLGIIFLAGVGLSLALAYWFSRQLQSIFNQYRATRLQHLTELEELNRQLAQQSRTDALTGTANRGYFNEQLGQQLGQANRYGDTVCLLLLDIDHFKQINDTHGHLSGDQVLQELARLIQANIRQTDLFARWGGEEFVVLAPGITLEQAMQMAEKLRTMVMNHHFPVDLDISCSFGVGQHLASETTSDFLQRVDNALYQAKNQGRNCCVMAALPPSAQTE